VQINFSVTTNSRIIISSAMAALGLLASCGPTNPDKGPPAPTVVKVQQVDPVAAQVDYKPKADILFVIDNSDSMDKHQLKVKKNIDGFVQAFSQNQRLDFHIGVVSIFDSKRFGPVVKDFYPLGKLRPLVDPAHPGEAVAGPPFITRAPRFNEILGSTLNIGVIHRGSKKKDLGGPEFEESFSAALAAIDGRNPGFIRKEAHLAIVMLTDGDDWSNISASEMDRQLFLAKGMNREKYSAYGVLSLGKDSHGKACPTDPDGGPTKIMKFLSIIQGQSLSLCGEDFGQKLAAVGKIIEQKATRLKVDLKALPDINTLKVSFGGIAVPQDASTGWSYDPEYVQLVFGNQAFSKNNDPNAKLSVQYTPVDPRIMGTKKAHPAGI
jgi:hypothetical protein